MTRAPVSTAWVTATAQSRSLYDHVGILALVLGVELRQAEPAAETLQMHERRGAFAERDRRGRARGQEMTEAP